MSPQNLRIYRKREVAERLGITTQALGQRLRRGRSPLPFAVVRRGKGRRHSDYSMIIFYETERDLQVVKFFYGLGADRLISVFTFRDIFNHLVEQSYDFYRFLADYDDESVLGLLGYSLEGLPPERQALADTIRELGKKLFVTLTYAFAVFEEPNTKTVLTLTFPDSLETGGRDAPSVSGEEE